MIGKLLRGAAAIVVYFCIATLIAQALGLGYLWSSGRLSREKVAQIVMISRGVPLPAPAPARPTAEQPATAWSLEAIEAARGLRLRQLELREQALANQREQMARLRDELEQEKKHFEQVRMAFEERLQNDKLAAIVAGNENARLLLESIKPKQSKDLIMMMLEAEEIEEVVVLLSAMPIARRAKIAAEFKTEQELKHLDEILRRTREGLPDAPLIDQAQQQLQQGE